MRRSFLAVSAAYGVAHLLLAAYPDAWEWAWVVVSTLLVPVMWVVAGSLERPAPVATMSTGAWCKVYDRDVTPYIRCNQEPGHAGPHAFIIEPSPTPVTGES